MLFYRKQYAVTNVAYFFKMYYRISFQDASATYTSQACVSIMLLVLVVRN
jgi:hypothetical protein